jgi:hypothetical protein
LIGGSIDISSTFAVICKKKPRCSGGTSCAA